MPLRGLTVNAQGQLLRDGVRFRNIGLNYGGGVVRIYSQPSTTACEYTPSAEQDTMLDLAQSLKVKVLRVKATPFWPAQWRYGVNGGVAGVAATAGDRAAHYAAMDAFVAKCRARDIGIIWTLFFRHASPCDLAGQTLRAGWLNSGATRTYVQTVTQEIVTRYLNEDAVLGYEWSNEVNHYNDASDATRGTFPAVNASYGSAASYSAANDMFTGSELAGVLTWWSGIVTAIDSSRIVLSGNGPNSYSQPGGTAGISTPMRAWHVEQVRDNPLNCGSIHWYGNVGYGSNNFRGLNSILTGVRHWQRANGRGFVLGEFGNQPWQINSISTAGGVATINCAASCPVEVGDSVGINGTGTALDGQWLTLQSVSASRDVLTAATPVTATYSGSVKGLQFMSGDRVARMCDDIINSGTDVALLWMLDGDTGRPIWESIDETGNAAQRAAILAANTRLGW